MRCRKARKLIPFHLAPDESWLGPEDRQALEAHMAVCESCRRHCEENREAIELLRECWQISEDTATLLGGGSPRKDSGIPICIAEYHGAGRRVPGWAVAACLVLGVLGIWALLGRHGSPSGIVGRAPEGGEKLPLIVASADGGRLAPGAVIQTLAGEKKYLALNSKHLLELNADGRLTIDPLTEAGRNGVLINLVSGEIYVHVEHDGNPFVVQTAHGRAVITGTTFDVRATEADTTLIVVEGTVQFQSEGGAIQVAGGHKSTIVAKSKPPSEPLACDAATVTVWARAGQNVERGARHVSVDGPEPTDLPATPPFWGQVQTDTNSIEYAMWVERNRDWFKQQFPWIFELKKALAGAGIETDYSDLLLRSGDVWRFAYPPTASGRQIDLDPRGLLRAVVYYGRDETWLRQHVLGSFRVANHEEQATISEAFERWAALIENQLKTGSTGIDSKVLLDSLDACVYLTYTRTLAALMIRMEDGAHWKSVGLLEEQLQFLTNCQDSLLGELGLGNPGADTCESDETLRALSSGIRRIGQLDEEIREYEKGLIQ